MRQSASHAHGSQDGSVKGKSIASKIVSLLRPRSGKKSTAADSSQAAIVEPLPIHPRAAWQADLIAHHADSHEATSAVRAYVLRCMLV